MNSFEESQIRRARALQAWLDDEGFGSRNHHNDKPVEPGTRRLVIEIPATATEINRDVLTESFASYMAALANEFKMPLTMAVYDYQEKTDGS